MVILKGFDMSDYLFPRQKKVTFEEAFPELENAKIKIAFIRPGREEKTATFTKDNFPGNGVKCSNPVCRNGGLSAIKIPCLIKKMISEKKLELEEHEVCNGGLYRGQTRYDYCVSFFNIEITIQFKEDT